MSQESVAPQTKVLVFSDDSTTRSDVIRALGRRVGPGIPDIAVTEVATADMVFRYVRDEGFDLLILDAETPKFGGMGLGKMIHDEIDADIPFILLLGRPQDEWLSRWSGAAAAVSYPIQPRELTSVVAQVLKNAK